MTSTVRKHLAMAVGVATLLTAEVATAGAQPAGPSPVEQLRRDTGAIHALGVSGVQARVIAPDGRQSAATSGTADLNTGRPVPPDGYFRMASTSKKQLWPGGRYGLGLVERPLSCGGTYWSHEGGDGGCITLNGVTDDGGRSAVVS